MAEPVYTTMAERIKNFFAANPYISDIDNGFESIEFRAILADVDGVPETIIEKSLDFKEGALSNELEWARNYTLQIGQEFNVANATGERLNFWGETLGYPRQTNEGDESYRLRILKRLRAKKLTKWAIIEALREFFTDDVTIYNGSEGAYYNNFFYGYYGSQQPPEYISPAIFRGNEGFFFEIIIPSSALEGVDPSYYLYFTQGFFNNQFFTAPKESGLNWARIIDLLDDIIGAGISYTIYLNE